MNPSSAFKITPGGWVHRYLSGAHGCCLNVCVKWAWEKPRRGWVLVLAGAIKSWLSCQLKGSEVKLILSETGRAVSLMESRGRGRGGCDLSIVMMDREREWGESSACQKSAVTRGEAGWLANSVTTWWAFLKPARKSRRSWGQRIKMCCCFWNSLSKWLRRHSALSENTSVEVKNNVKKSDAPGRVTDIT